MRRNFADVLKSADIDVHNEYLKIYELLFGKTISTSTGKKISLHDIFGAYFLGFYFRETCLSIEEFDTIHNFRFDEDPKDFCIADLVSICEYLHNMLIGYQSAQSSPMTESLYMKYPEIREMFLIMQIHTIMEKIGYEQSRKDDFIIYIEKSPIADSLVETKTIPDNMSYRLINYNHYSMKGNIDGKKDLLIQLATLLEPRRSTLKLIDSSLENDLFFLFNNANLRHNNVNPTDASKYQAYIASMSNDDLEELYDLVYQMCLQAFQELELSEKKDIINEFKEAAQKK